MEKVLLKERLLEESEFQLSLLVQDWGAPREEVS
jgi:hypothetical protein